MVSYEMLNEKAPSAFRGFQVKFREYSGGPNSRAHLGGTRLGPLFEIYVIKFCNARSGIAEICRDDAIIAY